MAKPFDATTKQLVEAQPAAWLEFAGLLTRGRGTATIEVIEADLSTVTAEADRVLRVTEAAASYLAHLEFQSGYDATMGERLLRYNALLRYRHALPVRSVVVLLRPEADGPAVNGLVESGSEAAQDLLRFRYRVVRVYEQPVEAILTGGLTTLPLAPLADLSGSAVGDVVRRMGARIDAEAAPAEAGMLWTATYVLMGLRYPSALTEQLLRGVRQMKESVTYQAILAEGVRDVILRQGVKRFGAPSAQAQAALAAITSVERLEQLAERLLEVETWDELLA